MINVIEQLKPFQLKKIDISSSNFVRVVPPRLWRKLMHEEIWKLQVVRIKEKFQAARSISDIYKGTL